MKNFALLAEFENHITGFIIRFVSILGTTDFIYSPKFKLTKQTTNYLACVEEC